MSSLISYLNFQGLLFQVGTVHRIESFLFPLRLTLFSILVLLIWVKKLQKTVEDGVAVRVYNLRYSKRLVIGAKPSGCTTTSCGSNWHEGSLCPIGERELVSCRHICFPHATFLKRYIWNKLLRVTTENRTIHVYT